MPPEPRRAARGGGGAAAAAAAAASSSMMATASGTTTPFFVGAPITKLLFFLVLACYGALHSHHWNQSTVVQALSPILRRFTYPTVSELVVTGSLLVLWSRTMERTMGSKQLVRLMMVTAIVSFWGHQLLRAVQFHQHFVGQQGHEEDETSDTTSTAPADFRYVDLYVGVLFWFYHRHTPRLYPRFLHVRGTSRLHGSEKSLYYAWFLYGLILASRNSSSSSSTTLASEASFTMHWFMVHPRLAAIFIGMASGILFPTLSRFAIVPDRWSSVVASRIGSVLQPPPHLYVPTFGGGGLGGGTANTGFAGQHGHYRPNPIAHQAAAAAAAAAAPVVPRPSRGSAAPTTATTGGTGTSNAAVEIAADPAAVETLVGMGFDRDQVVQALRATRNDVQGAANLLLASA